MAHCNEILPSSSMTGFEWLEQVAHCADRTKALHLGLALYWFAWISGETPSPDPTPTDPLALKLALAQPDGQAVYLARPCQFTGAETCPQKYWTEARFASEVVSAMNLALDQLKTRFSAKEIQLVGYSGGGGIAALLAARRNDVSRLITVAGNLDHTAWTRLHRISPMTGSLNPADEAYRLRHIPQVHLVGGKDRNIPAEIARSFTRRGEINSSAVRIFDEHDHHCCWLEDWPRIYLSLSASQKP